MPGPESERAKGLRAKNLEGESAKDYLRGRTPARTQSSMNPSSASGQYT
jgi:hypothetical protein